MDKIGIASAILTTSFTMDVNVYITNPLAQGNIVSEYGQVGYDSYNIALKYGFVYVGYYVGYSTGYPEGYVYLNLGPQPYSPGLFRITYTYAAGKNWHTLKKSCFLSFRLLHTTTTWHLNAIHTRAPVGFAC